MRKVLSQEEIDALFSAMLSKDGHCRETQEPVRAERREVQGARLRLPLRCGLRGASVSMEDLLRISVGDTLNLNVAGEEPVYLCVGGEARFLGRMVRLQGKRAFEVSGRVSHRKRR
jgi:flagellar motor switch protein FliM